MHAVDALLDTLDHAPRILLPLVHSAPKEHLKTQPAPGRWSIHEHACHLADVHPLFFERLDHMLSTARPRIHPYDPATALPSGALLDVELEEALERYTEDRARMMTRLRELTPDDWGRTAEHGEYSRYSVFIMFRHLALHDYLHAYRIEELVLKRW